MNDQQRVQPHVLHLSHLYLAMTLNALCLVALASSVAAQGLIDLRYSWPYTGPYRVDTQSGSRGQMQGYNQARLDRCLFG